MPATSAATPQAPRRMQAHVHAFEHVVAAFDRLERVGEGRARARLQRQRTRQALRGPRAGMQVVHVHAQRRAAVVDLQLHFAFDAEGQRVGHVARDVRHRATTQPPSIDEQHAQQRTAGQRPRQRRHERRARERADQRPREQRPQQGRCGPHWRGASTLASSACSTSSGALAFDLHFRRERDAMAQAPASRSRACRRA